MTEIYCAIGDIHGRDDLFDSLRERIVNDRHLRRPNVSASLVHVGDYVDGGANSVGVIDRLVRTLPNIAWAKQENGLIKLLLGIDFSHL